MFLSFCAVHAGAESQCWKNRDEIVYPIILSYGDLRDERDFAAFRAHYDAFREKNYSFVSLADFLAAAHEGKSLPEKSVIFTFDGAFASQWPAAQFLAKEGRKAVFFVPSNWVGRSDGESARMDWAQLREIKANRRFEIGSMSYSHPDLKTVREKSLVRELERSAKALRQGLAMGAHEPRYIAYPYGSYDAAVAREAARFHSLALTRSQDALATPDFDLGIDPCFQVPRLAIDVALRSPEKLFARIERYGMQLVRFTESVQRTPSSVERAWPLRHFDRP